MAIERISLLGVPVDICSPDKLENQILELLAKPGTKQIIFLSIWDLLKARRKKSVFAETVRNADLVIPISKSILKGAKFLKRNIPHRYNPFECVIQILSILDAHFKTLYLFFFIKCNKITIYNEGNKAGYASKIIDQLPDGLINSRHIYKFKNCGALRRILSKTNGR